MGLMKIQAETEAESQAICGIIELLWYPPAKMPPAVLNQHGCRKVGSKYLNYCVIPDGSMTGSGDDAKDGILTNIKAWRKLPDVYEFKVKK
jgi:hypothetical protein